MGSAPSAPSGQAGINPLYAAVAKLKTNGTPQFHTSQGAPRNTGLSPTALTDNLPFGPTGQKKTALGT